MHIDVITIFPDYLAPLALSLSGRAQEAGVMDVTVHDLRQWTRDRHRTVDDTPYGGGAGMVMRPEPWGEALDALVPMDCSSLPTMLVPTPTGRRLTQSLAEELALLPRLLIACGRYEGIDSRVVEHARARMPVLEVSIGDYVVTGGEVAALVIIEAVVRLLPRFMGNPGSLHEESHGTGEGQGLLEYPTYTKPVTWRGLNVPAVLLSGHHAQVTQWRREQSLRRTARVRPDLLATYDAASLDPRDREVLAEEGWPGG